MNRRLMIVAAVIGFHVISLWALQAGLLRRAIELVVPVQVMAEFIELPQPQVPPAPEPPQPKPQPVRKPRPNPPRCRACFTGYGTDICARIRSA
jgi:protein TonB